MPKKKGYSNNNKKPMGGSPGGVAGKGLSAGGNKVNVGAAPKGTSHNQVPCDAPAGKVPTGNAESSGAVKHARSPGKGIENLNGAPKSYTM